MTNPSTATKYYSVFTPRSDRKLTCIAAESPTDQAEVNRFLCCHPYGYARRLTGGWIGLFCPDSLADLKRVLADRGFVEKI